MSKSLGVVVGFFDQHQAEQGAGGIDCFFWLGCGLGTGDVSYLILVLPCSSFFWGGERPRTGRCTFVGPKPQSGFRWDDKATKGIHEGQTRILKKYSLERHHTFGLYWFISTRQGVSEKVPRIFARKRTGKTVVFLGCRQTTFRRMPRPWNPFANVGGAQLGESRWSWVYETVN